MIAALKESSTGRTLAEGYNAVAFEGRAGRDPCLGPAGAEAIRARGLGDAAKEGQ